MLDIETIHDPGYLRTVCRAYEASHRILVDRLANLARRIAELEGPEAAQAALELPDLQLLAVEPTTPQPVAESPKAPRKPQRGHGPKPQPKLPVEVIEHDFTEPPPCPSCGKQMSVWPGQFESCEEITVIETSFKICCHQRAKYRCGCHGAVLTARRGPARQCRIGRQTADRKSLG